MSKSLRVRIHSCALKSNGGVLCWGSGEYGQLGNNASGTTNKKDHPVPVKSVDGASHLNGITYISAGKYFTCALSYEKRVYCWGNNVVGQLGNNVTGTDSPLPVLVIDGDSSTNALSDITQVELGDYHTCALNSSGNTYCWGYGTSGQLGNGESGSTNYPVLVVDGQNSTSALESIDQVGGGDEFSCALNSSGGVLCWGAESDGRLGNNETTGTKNYPVNVKDSSGASASDITGISHIAIGDDHVCALKNDGEILCWGVGTAKQLGNDASSNTAHAVTVIDGDNSTTALDLGTPAFSRYVCNTNGSGTTCATATD